MYVCKFFAEIRIRAFLFSITIMWPYKINLLIQSATSFIFSHMMVGESQDAGTKCLKAKNSSNLIGCTRVRPWKINFLIISIGASGHSGSVWLNSRIRIKLYQNINQYWTFYCSGVSGGSEWKLSKNCQKKWLFDGSHPDAPDWHDRAWSLHRPMVVIFFLQIINYIKLII